MIEELSGQTESRYRGFMVRSDLYLDGLRKRVDEVDSVGTAIDVLQMIGRSASDANDRGETPLRDTLYELKYETLMRLVHMKASGVTGIIIEMRKIEAEGGEVNRLHFCKDIACSVHI